jgi:DNA-binding MarR family transcriptional regulator
MNDRQGHSDLEASLATTESARVDSPRFSYAVAALERSIRRSLTGTLRQFGLTVAQYTTLSLIGRRTGYSNAQLARRSFVSPQAMHEMISELQARALLERAQSSTHGTILLTYLTEAGRQLLDRCDATVDVMEQRMLAERPEAWRAEVIRFLMEAARKAEGPLTTE